MEQIQMEVCANGLTSALAAQEGGAIRVELCDNLGEGGTTPSYAQIKLATAQLNMQVYPIIRPRGGDFLYSALEFELMKADVQCCKDLGCDGVVIGMLLADGRVDKTRCASLIALARPMKVTFHRAFDRTNDLKSALEDIIALGCDRILTSGGKPTALEGALVIRELLDQAAGRIEIMPGSGIREHNVRDIIEVTGAKVFHATAKIPVSSTMQYINEFLNQAASADENNHELTTTTAVHKLIQKANAG
ncbi:copper homeostasis protein [Pedobacter sp. CAN_A7]|uniref:copper homeostasis protein CutC n=1 Tax=Pedobacter sp. CAN_A7 TaxID=2787722 RepID=UPI001A33D18E